MKNQVKNIRLFLREFPLDRLLKLEASILKGEVKYCQMENCLIGFAGGNTDVGYMDVKFHSGDRVHQLAVAAENEFLMLGHGDHYFKPARMRELPDNPYTENRFIDGKRETSPYRDLLRSATLLRLVVDELERRIGPVKCSNPSI